MHLTDVVTYLGIIEKKLIDLRQQADATRLAHEQATAAVHATIQAQAQTFLDELSRNKARSIRN